MNRQILMMTSILVMSHLVAAEQKDIWITLGSDAVPLVKEQYPHLITGMQPSENLSLNNQSGSQILRITEANLPELSEAMHQHFNRCGGFIAHDSYIAAVQYKQQVSDIDAVSFNGYSIDNSQVVSQMLATLSPNNLNQTVTALTQFQNRYYREQSGRDAATWLKTHWQTLAQQRSDISVEFFNHSWAQPSVIATIVGTSAAEDIVVIGGHLDSINQSNPSSGRAPGADDNASGIAIVTATLKAIVESGYRPSRTVKLIGYAAEEVGLRGSNAIAQSFKQQGKNVIGVAQFDMTGNHGSTEDVVFMTDYTNAAQNGFMTDLIEHYFPDISYGFDQCGYGCSDHAAWHNLGYPASIPFESRMADINPRIHTHTDDSFDANHAIKFAKLAVAYTAEMAKSGVIVDPPPASNELQNGIEKTGLTVQSKQQLLFTIDVPQGAQGLRFNTFGGQGDADLYVRFEQKPSLQQFDCNSTTSTSSEVCDIVDAQAGIYHVMVEAWNDIKDVTLIAQYNEAGTLPEAISRTETNLKLNKGQWTHFSQPLEGQYRQLKVSITGGTGDADLYINKGVKPTSQQYQCRPYKAGNNEACTINNPDQESWYISIYGYSNAEGLTLHIDATP